jgi:hypothetical protein
MIFKRGRDFQIPPEQRLAFEFTLGIDPPRDGRAGESACFRLTRGSTSASTCFLSKNSSRQHYNPNIDGNLSSSAAAGFCRCDSQRADASFGTSYCLHKSWGTLATRTRNRSLGTPGRSGNDPQRCLRFTGANSWKSAWLVAWSFCPCEARRIRAVQFDPTLDAPRSSGE